MKPAARVECCITNFGALQESSRASRPRSYCLQPRSSRFTQASGLLLKVTPKGGGQQ